MEMVFVSLIYICVAIILVKDINVNIFWMYQIQRLGIRKVKYSNFTSCCVSEKVNDCSSSQNIKFQAQANDERTIENLNFMVDHISTCSWNANRYLRNGWEIIDFENPVQILQYFTNINSIEEMKYSLSHVNAIGTKGNLRFNVWMELITGRISKIEITGFSYGETAIRLVVILEDYQKCYDLWLPSILTFHFEDFAQTHNIRYKSLTYRYMCYNGKYFANKIILWDSDDNAASYRNHSFL